MHKLKIINIRLMRIFYIIPSAMINKVSKNTCEYCEMEAKAQEYNIFGQVYCVKGKKLHSVVFKSLSYYFG